MRRASLSLLFLAVWALALAAVAAGAEQNTPRLSLEPATVKINAFFDGAELKVRGQAPAGDQVGVLLASAPQNTAFRIKERLWGFLWMNRDTAAFHGVPTVYMYQGSHAPADSFGLGLSQLRAQARVQSGKGDPGQLFGEFVKIKEGEGLYRLSDGGVSLGQTQGGQRGFECLFNLPARVPPGVYQVRAFLKGPDGRVVPGASRQLKIEEVGFPALLSSLAYNYGLLYGVLASLVALVGGLITSMLFKGGGGSH